MAATEHVGIHSGKLFDDDKPGMGRDENYHGTVRNLCDAVTLAAAVEVNSVVYMAKVPTNAILSPRSLIEWSAAGASVKLDLGFRNHAKAGVTAATDVLIDNLDVAAAGSNGALEDVALADRGKFVWEVLGLDEDPRAMLDLIATVKGANLSNETVLAWDIQYTSY